MKKLEINEAIELLKKKEIVAIPTETVYGLAADATSDEAVGKIFKAKGRPSDNPLIVHIGKISQVGLLASDACKKSKKLMENFWPGPLTVILHSNGKVSDLVTAGLSTVGIRMPCHKLALELLQKSGIPLAAPSANISGKPSPTTANHVINDMDGKIPGVVDGGICSIGLESTVIDMTANPPVILRPGGISKSQIEAVIGKVLISDGNSGKPKSPGMKYAHYSPDAEVYIVEGSKGYWDKLTSRFGLQNKTVGILANAVENKEYPGSVAIKTMGMAGQSLYAALREFDDEGIDIVLCEASSDEAVMNRLMKASEERILSEV